MVAVAIGGAAVVGAVGSVAAGKSNSKAIDKSSDASLLANRETLAAQTAMFDKQLASQQSALTQGLGFQTSALNQSNSFNTQAYNNSGQLQTDVRNQNIGILNPLAQTGYAAMNGINGLVGLPQQQAYHPQDINFTPISVAPVTAPAPPVTAPATPATTTPTTPALSANQAAALAAAYGRGY